MRKKHLTFIHRIQLSCANRFLVHKQHAFICDMYGSANEIHIIDLENPEEPKLIRSIPFKSAIGSVAIQNETLYATESGRAIHKFTLEDVSDPKYSDSYVLLGYDFYDLKWNASRAILAMNWDGVGIVDLNRSNEIQPKVKQKIEKEFVKRLIPSRDRFLLTNGISEDKFLYEISVQNETVEILSKHEFPNFNPSEVFAISNGVVLFGESKKGKKEYSSVLILDENLQAIGEPIRFERAPNVCLSLSDGNVLFGFDYSYALFDRLQHTIVPLFQQFEYGDSKEYIEVQSDRRQVDPEYDLDRYEDEERDPRLNDSYYIDSLKCAHKEGDYLFATHGESFISFRIADDSLFQKIL
ncbi:hypothetical protein LEP1GSC163_1143 [Leptospira santarosai str. CBC379]|uniref:Uncharacterized protein n=1 Tax=Leptospira santarosai str. MOR084 TaxID=1049984 RepID=A0A0E2BKV1_9LEPT|nr:hypothetical protein [Leptospira santarosai]EKO35869.1 hypothetical protein LEP1GSC179_0254 [Leptospira santarosai str. MOR084]EKR93243.1 hypothetical protein LEP1GSC163_1143 [Leptospira santarosai str. CBC379]